VPEKSSDGKINRVVVHVSGLGGGNPKIPFQPGLALGSVVYATDIDKLIAYAQANAEITQWEDEITDCENKIKELEQKEAIYSQKASCTNLVVAFGKQKELVNAKLKKAITSLEELVKKFETDKEDKLEKYVPTTTFRAVAESPIDKEASVVQVLPWSFDSMTFRSNFISMESASSSSATKNTASSSSSSFSASAEYNGFFVSGGAHFSRTVSEAIASRLTEIKKSERAEGVLVINAFSTTRNVRVITDLKYNLSKLEGLKGIFDKDKVDEKEKEKYGISKDGKIYLLTEAILGGSFTALVTQLKTSQAQQTSQSSLKNTSSAYDVGGHVGGFGMKASVNASGASNSSRRNESDSLSSRADVSLQIEFICQGALPLFGRNLVTTEIMKHLHLAPTRNELVSQDLQTSKELLSNDTTTRMIANQKRQLEMGRLAATISACRETTTSSQTYNVHTIDSVYQAYESFAEQMAKDENCGVPIGFNYTILDKTGIENEIRRLSVPKPSPNPSPSLIPSNDLQPTLSASAASAAAASAAGPKQNVQ
jgi:cell division protein FtsB